MDGIDLNSSVWQDGEWYDIDVGEDYKVIHSLPVSSDSYLPSGFNCRLWQEYKNL